KPTRATRRIIRPATIWYLNRSQNTRVSRTASREGGWTVGIIRYAPGGSNRSSVVLCHAKVPRARATNSSRKRNQSFRLGHACHKTNASPIFCWPASSSIGMRATKFFPAIHSYSMNAFLNSFEALLGLGVQPQDLTFVQI